MASREDEALQAEEAAVLAFEAASRRARVADQARSRSDELQHELASLHEEVESLRHERDHLEDAIERARQADAEGGPAALLERLKHERSEKSELLATNARLVNECNRLNSSYAALQERHHELQLSTYGRRSPGASDLHSEDECRAIAHSHTTSPSSNAPERERDHSHELISQLRHELAEAQRRESELNESLKAALARADAAESELLASTRDHSQDTHE